MATDPIQHERELREQWQQSHEKYQELWQHNHERWHRIADEALKLARDDVERRLEAMNELRAQISSERGMFITRELYDEQHSALRDAVDVRLKLLENTKSNLEGRIWMLGGIISLIVIGVNLFMRYWGGK